MKNKDRKESIVNVIEIIYKNLDKDLRTEISSTINDLVGKYSEAKTNHKAYAEYISTEALEKLERDLGRSSINASDLHKFISKKDNNFRHEHIVPKNAIRLALEFRDESKIISIPELLEEFSGCTIILAKEEDTRLTKKTHPHIDPITGEFCLKNFKKQQRYAEAKGKPIKLVKFTPKFK